MRTWLKIGMRNLLKNRRRSVFSIGAVALGFAAVNLFGGFTDYIFGAIEGGYIYVAANGHLGIFRKGFLSSTDPARHLLSADELNRIQAICRADRRVEFVTPELTISGLVSNGHSSTVFVALGCVPSGTEYIRDKTKGMMGAIRPFTGTPQRDDDPHAVGMTRGLAGKLGLTLDDDAIVMAPTVDGQMNALDVKICQFFNAPAEALDDKMMVVPLACARNLYDTDGADRLKILLRRTSQTDAARRDLAARLEQAGLDVDVRTWHELRPSYHKIRNMFTIIFLFVFLIVFVIVVLSIVNTISMAVMERTREIGTLRTLGLKRRGVVAIFAAESFLLGFLGIVPGLALTLLVWWGIRAAHPTWIPPTVSTRIPLLVFIVPEYLAISAVLLVCLAVAAAVLPASRAARMDIIDALGHV